MKAKRTILWKKKEWRKGGREGGKKGERERERVRKRKGEDYTMTVSESKK